MEKYERVIKEPDGRDQDIAFLSKLLLGSGLSTSTKNQIEQEIRNIRAGIAAEKRASYLLGQLIKSNDSSYLINDLRIEIDGDACQIDHLTLNRFGMVKLFETKSFSTGIKIDDDGSFWRWDVKGSRYVEIPSPIRQSERHELVLRKVLHSLGYPLLDIQHYVLIDYKSKLIKPKDRFSNVCRPDAVSQAISSDVDKLSGTKVIWKAAKMLTNKISETKCAEYAKSLITLHQPIVINFGAKFGLKHPFDGNDNKSSDDVKPTTNIAYEKLTESKMAKKLELSVSDLKKKLQDYGYMERRGRYLYLTQKGKDEGIEFRKGAKGFFYLYPLNFNIQ